MADRSSSNHNATAIILATAIPSIFLVILAAALYYRARRRKAQFITRGITPIDDEEIESWRIDRTRDADEKSAISPQSTAEPKRAHQVSTSVGSVKKPPSVIIYQSRRCSDDQSPRSPSYGKRSVDMDMPQTPILARAPNSRPGLTDESVQGDDAFVRIKRQPSRRNRHSPGSGCSRHGRNRSTRSSFGGNAGGREPWYARTPEQNSPRHSGDTFSKSAPSSRSGHRATLSTPTNMTRDSYDEEFVLGGLSPRPLIHRSEIGRAIG